MVLSRDVYALCGCWACTLTASTLVTACAPLAVKHIGASVALAPFTIGAFLFGAAGVSLISSRLFVALGRAGGFAVGCGLGFAGGALGVAGLESASPWAIFARRPRVPPFSAFYYVFPRLPFLRWRAS